MEPVKLDVGQLIGAMGEEVQRNIAAIGIAVVVLIVGNLAMDRWLPGTSSFTAAGILSLAVQYGLTRHALDRAGLLPEGAPSRFGSLWGMSIVTGLLCLFGFILLILPGVYMVARWMLAAPIILAEDKSMSEGMSESWANTKESVWSIVGALLIIFIAGYGIGMTLLFVSPTEEPPTEIMAVSYFFLFLASTLGWLMAVGAYRLMVNRAQSLEEIFA
jgi:hypothetical protein